MTDTNSNDLPKLEDVIDDISRILDETGLNPSELTVAKYAKEGGKYDGRKLRRLGGFNAILDEAFRQDTAKDFRTVRHLARRRSYVNKLERKLGDWEALRQDVLHGMEAALTKVGPWPVSDLKKPALPEKIKKLRENGALISDIHLGLKVDSEEIPCNQYNWQIAARRLGKYTEQVASYKIEHRNECPQLRVMLGGDLGQGIIHMDDAGTDLITYQVIGIAYYITQMIDFWRHHYKKIVVECTPDNHMRLTHKGPDRSYSQKFDSFATMVHVMVQFAFRECKDVEFHVPKSAVTTFTACGHKMALTHGDTHLNSSNVGKHVPVEKIVDQVLRMNANVRDGKFYKAIFMGHVHVPMYLHMPECDTALVVNGTGSGTDGYAHGIGIHASSASQVMFEMTEKHAIGDFRKVDMGDADDEARYEEIIKPYEHGLEIDPMFGIKFPKK